MEPLHSESAAEISAEHAIVKSKVLDDALRDNPPEWRRLERQVRLIKILGALVLFLILGLAYTVAQVARNRVQVANLTEVTENSCSQRNQLRQDIGDFISFFIPETLAPDATPEDIARFPELKQLRDKLDFQTVCHPPTASIKHVPAPPYTGVTTP